MTEGALVRPELLTIDEQISRALAAVRCARAASARSSTAKAVQAENVAQQRLDLLLDRRFAAQRRVGV